MVVTQLMVSFDDELVSPCLCNEIIHVTDLARGQSIKCYVPEDRDLERPMGNLTIRPTEVRGHVSSTEDNINGEKTAREPRKYSQDKADGRQKECRSAVFLTN